MIMYLSIVRCLPVNRTLNQSHHIYLYFILGVVAEPVRTDYWFSNHLRPFSHPPPAKLVTYTGAVVNVVATLGGAEITSLAK